MVCALDDDNALCIVRDHSGISVDSKITLTVPGEMAVPDFIREVANRFNYEPDSFELILQSGRPDDVILNENCTETLQALGINVGISSRNAFLLVGLCASSPRLKASSAPAEEELSLGASASPTTTSGDYPPPPQPLVSSSTDYPYTAALIKQDTGYVGLVNQAMTCYLNSLLQALYMTPEFRNALYKWKFDFSNQTSEKSIPYQLQKLFLNLQTSCKNAVETTELTRSFGWDSSEAWHQHDIQELCRVMFDALEQVFKDTEQFDLIDRLYQGKMIDYVKCLECGREKSREDTFLDIPLPVRPFGSTVAYSSVEEALRAFVQPETLEGNNQYHCESCSKKCDAHKGLKFSKFPYLLTLHLKRFDFDYNTMHRIKLNDKVVFPEILDLNSFIIHEKDDENESFPEELTIGKCDDSSTTDSGSALDDESCQGTSDQPQSMEAAQDDDEGIDVSGGNGSNHHENEKNRRHALQKGPYMYELFSIMIHSGSASGGHYYAYIKDFSNGEWFCFNDQSVTRITNDDITKTYGGGGAFRGYYSGAYSSSTNAYMLMYRQINKEVNCEAFSVEQFPPHIKELYKKIQEGEETDRKIKEKQSDMCKIKLYCNYPKCNKESKLYCYYDTPLKEVTELAYKNLKIEGIVPLEDCRLVNYSYIYETIEASFEGRENDHIGDILSSLKSMCKNDFLLDIKAKDEEFQVYQPGGAVIKVHKVDMEEEDIAMEPEIIRCNLSQTVSSLKDTIAALLNMDSTNLTIVLKKYGIEVHLVEEDNCTLKQARFDPSNKIFVCSGPCDPDPKKPFITSKLHKIINKFDNIIILNVAMPDVSPETLSRLSIPTLTAAQSAAPCIRQRSSDSPADKVICNGDSLSSRGLVLPLLLSGGNTSGSGDEDVGETLPLGTGGQSDQSASEDSSLTDSDRTLIGDECPCDDVDYQMASPTEDVINAVPLYSKATTEDVAAENWDEDDVSPSQPPPVRKIYFKAFPYVENGQKMLKVLIDKRTILRTLISELEPYVGVPHEYFKIYRMYSGQQEYEVSRPRDSLGGYKNNERLTIKLGRALRNGECSVKVHQLIPDNVPPFKFLFEWIIAKGRTVGETKREILDELNRKYEIAIPFDSCRLRKKNWKNPVKVLLDSQKWGDDVQVYSSNFDIILQELSGPEVVTSSDQLLLFAKRWHPSTMSFSMFEEVVLDGLTTAELKQKLSEKSGIPVENVEFTKGSGVFPCEVSVFQVSDLEWNHNGESLDSWPLHITEDGCVILYRDSREELKNLTAEERTELTNKESVRLNSPSTSKVSSYSPRKERPLKIYLDQTPQRPKVTVDPDID
uniref:Ubiquitin carboxyl-terminal hydrolase 47 n=1 Tax=Clastoptera arizonana TaxID=38151 RepID=A0A1B6DYN4_9HEMI